MIVTNVNCPIYQIYDSHCKINDPTPRISFSVYLSVLIPHFLHLTHTRTYIPSNVCQSWLDAQEIPHNKNLLICQNRYLTLLLRTFRHFVVLILFPKNEKFLKTEPLTLGMDILTITIVKNDLQVVLMEIIQQAQLSDGWRTQHGSHRGTTDEVKRYNRPPTGGQGPEHTSYMSGVIWRGQAGSL